ncbi:MAG: response regulator [Sphingomicrobium sp.]
MQSGEPDQDGLAGKKILLVEDSPVVSDIAEEVLGELGCVVVGPAANLATGRELASEAEIDAAIVDVRIRGDKSFGICDLLDDRGVPFILTSGYADWPVPEKWENVPQLPKPYKLEDVEAVLKSLFAPKPQTEREAS